MGLGIGLTMSPMSTAAMNAVDATKAGVASGILSMSRMVGGTFGVAAVGALFQHISDNRLERPARRPAAELAAAGLVHGQPRLRRRRLAPAAARPDDRAARSSDALKDTFVHSLSASLKLSTAVAAAGVVIALAMLRDAPRARARVPVPAVGRTGRALGLD